MLADKIVGRRNKQAIKAFPKSVIPNGSVRTARRVGKVYRSHYLPASIVGTIIYKVFRLARGVFIICLSSLAVWFHTLFLPWFLEKGKVEIELFGA